MKIHYIGQFVKHFKKRIKPHPDLTNRFHERVDLFIKSPKEPVSRDHQLKGKKQALRTFSITGDIRIVYFTEKDVAYFVDVGTHNQVY